MGRTGLVSEQLGRQAGRQAGEGGLPGLGKDEREGVRTAAAVWAELDWCFSR